MDAQTTLVIILSLALAMFLVLAIVLAVMLIRVTKKVHHITDKAELAADNLVSASRVVKKSLRPAVITGALSHVTQKFLHRGQTPKKAAKPTKKT